MNFVKHLAIATIPVVVVLFALGQFPSVRTKILGV